MWGGTSWTAETTIELFPTLTPTTLTLDDPTLTLPPLNTPDADTLSAVQHQLWLHGQLAPPAMAAAPLEPLEPAEQYYSDLTQFFAPPELDAPAPSPDDATFEALLRQYNEEPPEQPEPQQQQQLRTQRGRRRAASTAVPARDVSPSSSCSDASSPPSQRRRQKKVVNVNEIYSLKKFSDHLVARIEAEVGESLLRADRHTWKQFLDHSSLNPHEQDCAKALRRKYCSRRYASGTRARKNQKIEDATTENSVLQQENVQLRQENLELRRQLELLRHQLAHR